MCGLAADTQGIGYHLPRVRARDSFYTRLENERAANKE
jgi:hypothetical protein